MNKTLRSMTPVLKEVIGRGWLNKSWTTMSGVKRGGCSFDKASLHVLLTNSIYAGKIKHKELVYDGEHEAIVDQTTFDAVQKLLKSHSRGKGNHVNNKYGALLKGLLYCGACNKAMVHTMSSRGSKRYRYYTCLKAIKCGWDACPSKALPAAELEAAVVDQIRCISTDDGLMQEVLRQSRKSVGTGLKELQQQQKQYEKQLSRDNAEIKRISAMTKPNDPTLARLAELNERTAQAEPELHQLNIRISQLKASQLADGEIKAAFSDFDTLWRSVSQREQGKLMEVLVERVEYDPHDVAISVSFHRSGIKTLAAKADEVLV